MKTPIKFLLIFSLISPMAMLAQSVISASGSYFANQNGSVSFTMGETITGIIANNSGSANQGFQQPWMNVTGVEELTKAKTFFVVPNPAKEAFHISGISPYQAVQIKITTIKGDVLLMKTVYPNQNIDVSHLAKGFYIVIIENENAQQIEKLIIN